MNAKGPSPFRIVIVEDELVQRQALMDVLKLEGYHCEGFQSATAALAHEGLLNSDLLISDLNLPGMSGLEFIQTVRESRPDISAILITGHASLQTAIDAVRIGAVDYVLKPFRLSTMLTTVAKALEQQRLRREVARLQEDLSDRYDEVLLINKELDAFAARVSHDLRGPITNMKGVLQALDFELGHSLENDLRQLLLAGIRSGEKATKMVHDLLDFSRLGHQELQMQAIDLNELLNGVLVELQASIPLQGCSFEVGKFPRVQGHEGLLHQAFANLIGNAIKYSSQNPAPRVQIETAHSENAGFVRIMMIDNGVGFQSQSVEHLFKPFHRLHHPDEFPGEGMGLANVKRIVDRHGGTVSARPNPGGGACFSITLPLAAQEQTPAMVRS
ncbi:hybrid sensor histidine kinase/response regulator [Hydrogenophaga sp.]|uniref:sensor histidine kinase n=1 Tax=Hydrogenophaga sp. TaxID=1904254 RepID=UPI0026348395|nr:hybrid sensor histidine kinase/response regulator [Hydrogenophaga sp.]